MDIWNIYWARLYRIPTIFSTICWIVHAELFYPIYIFVSVIYYFYLGRHRSAFFSRRITLEIRKMLFACYINNVF